MLIKLVAIGAAAAALIPAVDAAPTNNTGSLAFPFIRRSLEARSSIIINCKLLCASPRWEEGNACNTVCQGNKNDESEHLNKKQRKNLALALFPDDADHINTLSRHGIKDYLLEHLDRSLFADSKRHHLDRRWDIFDEPGDIKDSHCVNCREICEYGYRYRRPADIEACRTVCDGEEDDECEYMNDDQMNAYLTAYFGPNWLSIPGLLKTWKDCHMGRAPCPVDNNDYGDKKRAVEQSAAATNATLHRLQARKTTQVNCKYLCDPSTSVHNQCACGAVCKHGRDKQDCKEEIHRMSKLRKLTECFFPGEAEGLYQDCKHAHHSHKCFQDLFDSQWPDMKHFHSSGDC
ncbi:uncharacterized protein CC84DRAFT_1257281 [Paraphaeosphaeria sporulosa]|uniref:Extracellular membrane protein CFEM domain-containing protein n=1 Tax=Paraphaeosphaeria sporulosa TaxID=1460663 RepID=A0A177CNN2_9PLEO|nr:uncharacterized protein CC84DRAFT_1257281 [Paraphaeosphaeria sporulosa]OAG08419.1 hypothetical protein CC84DRAFT_1257281 [Paraphaeosphaeria sporulosa]